MRFIQTNIFHMRENCVWSYWVIYFFYTFLLHVACQDNFFFFFFFFPSCQDTNLKSGLIILQNDEKEPLIQVTESY